MVIAVKRIKKNDNKRKISRFTTSRKRKALELDEITEVEISNMVIKELKI